jgi:3D (Asp-Asp-Asp) domain-containing protein
VFRYLNGTSDYKLQFGLQNPHGQKLQEFCDADYAGDHVDRHSVSGQLYLLNGGVISWNSGKQRCVATSTTEAEYIALSEASKQGQWIRTLIRELHRTDLLDESLATPIYSDNQGCIAIAKDPVGHRRTKHIDVRYQYIRQLITHGKATIAYLPTEYMVADILTKPLPLVVFKRCIQGLLAV